MMLTRRASLTIAGGAVAVGVIGYLGWRQFAPAPSPIAQAPTPVATTPTVTLGDQREAERSLGDPAAKVTVMEFFSLTCTHCAAFARETMPEVEKDLIGPGKVRFVYHDFPLDQVALTAAMVARYLPVAQYYPFVSALFANQDRWAFARGINTTEEIWKMAALAGMAACHVRQGGRRCRSEELDPAAAAGRPGPMEDRLDSELRDQWAEILLAR